MAQLALGIAGAAIGGALGGPIGAQVGWLLGSTLGGILDPPKQEGPRLNDLRLQKSAYGGMLPLLYGTHRLPGNVIWQTDLKEHKHKSGGKGGPEITNYTYSASFAIALCEGPIDHIRRVWANGRLMYDEDQGSDRTSGDFQFALYVGDEDQEPDPTMQAELGADEVPAYRGVCYVVFTDYDLTDFGNVIPNLEFEVAQKGVTGCAVSVVAANDAVASDTTAPIAFTGYVGGTFRITRFPKGGGSLGAGPQDPTTACSINSYVFDAVTLADLGQDLDNPPDPFPSEFDLIGPDPVNPGFAVDNRYKPMGFHVYTDGHTKALWKGFTVVSGSDDDVSIGDSTTEVNPTDGRHSVNTNGDWAHTAGVPAGRYLRAASFTGNNRATFLFTDTVASRFIPLAGSSYDCITEWWKVKNGLVVASGTCSGHYVDSGGVPVIRAGDFDTYGSAGNISEAAKASSFDMDERHCWYCSGDQVRMYHIDDDGDFALDTVCGAASMGGTSGGGVAVFAFKKGYCAAYVYDSGDRNLRVFTLIPEGGMAAITLGEIVADLSISTPIRHRAGLSEDDIDVEELTDLVDGYVVNTQGPIRNMLEPLQRAFYFDAAEIDDVVAFRKRGRASIATIVDGELAAREAGAEAPPPLTLVRTQEADLPYVLNIDYINNGADYQPGTQYAERQSARSQTKLTLTVPVAMTDDKAKAVAAANLAEAWLERDKGTIYLPRKYARLTPTDAITVKGRAWRIKQVVESKPGIFKLDIAPTLAAIYTQPQKSAPSTGIDSGSPPLPRPATDLLLLDIPLVGLVDYPPGFYAAMAPAAPGPWSGASLQKSIDLGASYTEIASTDTPATMGEALGVLGNFYGGNIFDEVNSVDVLMSSGELSGATALAVLNGANEFQLGLERIRSRDCTLIAENTYTLTGLLRGRDGTEWAMGSHEAGEFIVALPTLDVNAPAIELNQTRKYKAVTFGKTLESADAQDFANTGVRLKPFAPVELGGGVDGTGGVILHWTPRTRYGAELAGGPWSEATHTAIVEFWNASYTQCARTVTVLDATTYTYTAANQTTDFGATQAHVYFTVAYVGGSGLGTRARGVGIGGGSTDDEPLAPIAPYATGPLNPPPVVGGPADQTLVSGVRGYTSGFNVGGRYVWKFTTGATISLGSFASAEYIDPRMRRQATLSLNSDGTGPLASMNGTTVAFSFPFHATLAPLTDYYVIIEDKLANGAPSGVLGDPSNMFADLLLIP